MDRNTWKKALPVEPRYAPCSRCGLSGNTRRGLIMADGEYECRHRPACDQRIRAAKVKARALARKGK